MCLFDRTFPAPKNSTELNSFLDLTKAYNKSIQNYELHAGQLKELAINANNKIVWNLEAKEAFNQLIVDLINAPNLGFFKENSECRIQTDVNKNGHFCVFEQKDGDNWKPIVFSSYFSKSDDTEFCRDIERNAILNAIEEFALYIEHVNVSLLTNHDSYDFLGYPRWHRKVYGGELSELYLYLQPLKDNHIKNIGMNPASKHECERNCFDGSERVDHELNQLYFSSDSD